MINIDNIQELYNSYYEAYKSLLIESSLIEIVLKYEWCIYFLLFFIWYFVKLIHQLNKDKLIKKIKTPTTFYVRQSIAKNIYGKCYDSKTYETPKNVESQQNINIAVTEEFRLYLKKIFTINNYTRNIHSKVIIPHKPIVLRRKYILNDTYEQLIYISTQAYMQRKIYIIFEKEAGIDAGGLCREWINLFIKEIVSPSSGYFIIANEIENTVIPHNNQTTSENYHLGMYQLLGRIIAYCIILEINLDTKIDLVVFKQLLNQECLIEDLKNIDPLLTKGLLSVKNNPELFYFENDEGEELVSEGCFKPVTSENFDEYLYLYLKNKFCDKTRFVVDVIRIGFFEILPESIFTDLKAWEFYLLINGQQMIDIQEWKRRTSYQGYSETSQIIIWFWEYIEELDATKREKLLYAITSYKQLSTEKTHNYDIFFTLFNLNDNDVMTINRIKDVGSYPICHTCSRSLDLPEYKTKNDMIKKINVLVEFDVLEFYSV